MGRAIVLVGMVGTAALIIGMVVCSCREREACRQAAAKDARLDAEAAERAQVDVGPVWSSVPPPIAVDAAASARIAAVLAEMEHNYGGTLVCDPEDAALDSAAFVQRYLRRFAATRRLKDYDYRFERLLARLSEHPKPLDDERLDPDIWAAYRTYELITGGASSYQDGNTIYGLDNARDLLWTYLAVQAARIRSDAARRVWWLDRLAVDEASAGERLARAFATLQLAACAQEGPAVPTGIRVSADVQPPSGSAGLSWFSAQLGVGWRAWGLDPEGLPAPRVDSVNVSGRMTSIDIAPVVDQESWSHERQAFAASFWRPIGQRSGHASVRIPDQPSADGIFLFPMAGTLHLWPKSRMADGALRMLAVAGFLDEDSYRALVARAGAVVIESGGSGTAPAAPR